MKKVLLLFFYVVSIVCYSIHLDDEWHAFYYAHHMGKYVPDVVICFKREENTDRIFKMGSGYSPFNLEGQTRVLKSLINEMKWSSGRRWVFYGLDLEPIKGPAEMLIFYDDFGAVSPKIYVSNDRMIADIEAIKEFRGWIY